LVNTRRQCYFDGERQLKFFQIYTKANCELECLTNSTMRYCNCSAFLNCTFNFIVTALSCQKSINDIIYPFRVTFSEIQVYFMENQFLINKRSERYGFIDFISNCGGLMGLFMGISLLSIAELLHYFVYFLWELCCKVCYQDNRVYSLK
jgi:amiloride-sensitive sodium channel